VGVPAIRSPVSTSRIATFGFAIVMQQVGYLTPFMFGQQQRIEVRGHRSRDRLHLRASYYYLCLIVAVLSALVVLVVRRSRLGSSLRAMSDSPVALDAHGANTT